MGDCAALRNASSQANKIYSDHWFRAAHVHGENRLETLHCRAIEEKHCVLILHIKFSGDFPAGNSQLGSVENQLTRQRNAVEQKSNLSLSNCICCTFFLFSLLKGLQKASNAFLSALVHSYGRWDDWWTIRGSFSLMKPSLLAFCAMWKRET